MIFECVINISEGRDVVAIDAIAAAGDCVRDVHADRDHNRSVITLASRDLGDVESSAREVVGRALETLSLDTHEGVHPRLGVVDVVPFISYNGVDTSPSVETISAARSFGEWLDALGTPVFFYDTASPESVTLPAIRKHAFTELMPSLNVQSANDKTGATCVGAREPLIAINVNIDTSDLAVAQSIAREIRESSGGIAGVRAIGLELAEQGRVQVSMNIVDAVGVNAEMVCKKIRDIAAEKNYSSEVELVGLVPQFQFDQWSHEFLNWSGLDASCTVEHYV